MGKYALLLTVFSLMVAVVPTTVAQGERGLPKCTSDQVAEGGAVIAVASATYNNRATLPEDPTSDDFYTAILELDSLTYNYWIDFSKAISDNHCVEIFIIGYTSRYVFDDTLLNALSQTLAATATEMDNTDLADTLLASVETRRAALEDQFEAYDRMTSFLSFAIALGATFDDISGVPACSEAETTAVLDSVRGAVDAYLEFGELNSEMTADELDALIVNYESLTTSDSVIEDVPPCAEALELSFNTAFLFRESHIVALLERLAIYKIEEGNDELAMTLAASAEQRLAELETTFETYFADFMEESATRG